MYCKKCRNLLDENSTICPKCGYDSNNEFNIENTAELELQKIVDEQVRKNKKEKINIYPIIIIIIVMAVIMIIIYSSTGQTSISDQTTTVTVMPSTIPSEDDTTFKYNKLRVIYPDSFGSTGSTIFYKENENINIVFSTLDETEYNNYLNSTDLLDGKLNEFDIKTFAGDNYYCDLLVYKDVYYLITVNYVNDITIYTEDVQLTINTMLNSIYGK